MENLDQTNHIKKYKYHTDAGHGWLEVEVEEIRKLGLTDKISSYSYVNGYKMYLEEDCDMATFIKAAGIKYEDLEEVNDGCESKIRDYDRYENPRYESPFKDLFK